MNRQPNAEFSPEQLEQLKEQLTIKRQELTNSIDAFSKVIESRQDCDVLNVGDSASFNEAHDRAVTMSNHQKETIEEIDAALDRLQEGRYGISETNGEPIPLARLLIVPWARAGAGS